MKEDNDGAEPSSNSVAALNLLRLAQLRGLDEFRDRGEKTIAALAPILERAPMALPQMLVAFDYSLGKPQQIVIAGDKKKAQKLLEEVRDHYLPTTTILLADERRRPEVSWRKAGSDSRDETDQRQTGGLRLRKFYAARRR